MSLDRILAMFRQISTPVNFYEFLYILENKILAPMGVTQLVKS